MLFEAKNPFFAHYVLPRAQGNKRPSVVPNESIIRVLHGLNPLRILESSCDSSRSIDRRKYNGDAISRVGFDDGTFRSHLYGIVVYWGMGKGSRVWKGEEGEGVRPNRPTKGDG